MVLTDLACGGTGRPPCQARTACAAAGTCRQLGTPRRRSARGTARRRPCGGSSATHMLLTAARSEQAPLAKWVEIDFGAARASPSGAAEESPALCASGRLWKRSTVTRSPTSRRGRLRTREAETLYAWTVVGQILRALGRAVASLVKAGDTREQALVGREQALVGREQELVGREQELVGREQELAGREQALADRAVELACQELELAVRLHGLVSRSQQPRTIPEPHHLRPIPDPPRAEASSEADVMTHGTNRQRRRNERTRAQFARNKRPGGPAGYKPSVRYR